MVVRIKKHTFFSPRRCPRCHKICLFVRHPKGKCCMKCHEQERRISRRANRRQKRKEGTLKYNCKYQTRRKHLLKRQPWCSLCGATENLTTHHVGGRDEHLTVLCDECHQAYERWNNKRKVKKCRKKILIGGSNLWKNTMRTIRFHCLMFYYRIRLRLALEPQEARLAFVSSASGNTTN